MAAQTPTTSVHATLSTTVADAITWAGAPWRTVAVTNHDDTELLYVRPYGTNEVQTITLSSWDATDTVKFTHNSVESAAVTYSADVSAAIQAALESLPSIGAGNVLVTQTSVSVYVARFRGALVRTNVGAITVTNGTGSATGSVAETLAGAAATAVAASDGTYVVPAGATKVLTFDGPAPRVLSVVGNGNVYSVEGI